MSDSDEVATSARLTVIEQQLEDIIRRLDEMKNLLARLNSAPQHRHR
jgi:hypothetical protein